MNPQELYIDVSSGRFLDGETAIPVQNPSFFSDELKTLKLNVRRVKNNNVSNFSPSSDSRYKIRLGTPQFKLADGVDVSTAGPTLFTAQAIVTTKPSEQMIFEGLAVTFSPVTASLEPILNTTAGVTALVTAEVYQPTLVTAAVSLTYVSGTVTTSSTKIQADNLINFNPPGSWDRNQVPIIPPYMGSAVNSMIDGRFVLDLTALLNTGTTASAGATVNLNSASLQSVTLTNRGSGYFGDSVVAVVSGGRNPVRATFSITVSGGSVTTISVTCAGAGYSSGAYQVIFSPAVYNSTMPYAVATAFDGKIQEVAIWEDGGGNYNFPSATATIATASSVTATVSAAVSNGFVTSVTITNAGSGYTSNPTIVFQSPRGGIKEIAPTNAIGAKVNGRQRFLWAYGLDTEETIPPVPLNFSLPPQSVDDSVQTSVPSGFLHFVKDDPRGNIWEIELVSPGYGYTTAPVVTHDPALCSTSRLFIAPYYKKSKSNPLDAPVAGAATPGFYDSSYSTTNKNETKFFGLFIDRTRRAVIRYGGCAVDYATFVPNSYFRTDADGLFRRSQASCVNYVGGIDWDQMRHLEVDLQDYISNYAAYYKGKGATTTTTISYVGERSANRTFVEYSNNDVFMGRNISLGGSFGLFSRGNTEIFQAWTDGCLFTDAYFPRHETIVNNTSKPRVSIYGRGGYYPYQTFFISDPAKTGSPIPDEFDFVKFIQGTAGTSDFAVYGRRKKGISSARLGKYRMTIPPVNYNYRVHFIVSDYRGVSQHLAAVSSEYNKFANDILRDMRMVLCSIYGGGQFETFWEVEDYGNDLVQNIGGDIGAVADIVSFRDGAGKYSYKTDKPFFTSKTPDVVITTPTPGRLYGSYAPTVASRVVANGIEWYFSDGGLGVGDSFDNYATGYLANKTPNTTVITASVVSASSGYIGSARLTNTPRGYLDGIYDCSVGAPPSGTTAAVKLLVTNRFSSVVLENRGSGYTSAPSVTAPSPNETGGYIYKVNITNTPVGYPANNTFDCEVGDSPSVGGTARIILTSNDQGQLSAEIANNGFGYTSSPVVTAPGFSDNEIGKLTGIVCKNTPVGYIPDKIYQLEIQSPSGGLQALASVRFDENGVMTSFVDIEGFGYTSKPVITAPAPDREQGYIAGGVVLSSGLGYAIGSYPAIVDDPPAGGIRATARAIVSDQNLLPTLEILDAGFGYITKPRISVVTPAGSVVSGITITCQGNFYINETVNFEFSDATGSGVELAAPRVQSGKIIDLPVVFGGQNYTAPQIKFSPPTAPEIEIIPQNQVRQTVEITTASANSILGNSTEKNILLELYETDGTNEQVVVQGTAVLKKRVLE